MTIHIQVEEEADGRWIGEAPELPGCLAYGHSPGDARRRALALALRILADRITYEVEDPLPDELVLRVLP